MKERERELCLLRDTTARPIDRAGDVRLDLGAMTTQGQMQLFSSGDDAAPPTRREAR